MKTRAAVAYAAGKPLVIESVDLEGPKAGEVLVEIRATGVCHTDEFTRSGADLAVSVTGVAGPGGGSAEKPVGLVHFAGARTGHDIIAERHVFPGDRDGIRRVAVITALTILASMAER